MDETKGTRIVTTRDQRFRSPDFPGWGDPNYVDYLDDLPAGQTGVIVDVESHGSNPWRRYGILLDSGHRASGRVSGTDFEVFKS